MIENLTSDDFSPLTGDTFTVDVGGDEPLSFELTEVKNLGEASEQVRAPFSLLFHGPPQPQLPQMAYTLGHPQLGSLGIFLVPVGPDVDGRHLCYEAVFT